MKVRLQIGVATVFTLLTTVLLGVVIAYLYVGNRELALSTAHDEMLEARKRSVNSMLANMQQTAQAVSSLANFVTNFPEQAQSLRATDFMHSLSRGSDHFYSIYFAMEQSGKFYQNVILQHGAQSFGKNSTPLPAAAERVVRVIDDKGDVRTEAYFWARDSGGLTLFQEQLPDYDPRTRPWYLAAMESDEIHITTPYIFESTGQPGITFAKRVVDDSGGLVGVVGIDITMSTVSRILEDIRIGARGLVFMLDNEQNLISYTDTKSSGEGTTFLTSDTANNIGISNATVAQAISLWRRNQESYFYFTSEENAESYVASVGVIPEIFGTKPILGLAVPVEEFVGPINRTTQNALHVSGFVFLVAVLSTIIVARLISTNLNRLADQALRISNFELGEDLKLRTMIQEVSALERAMTSMQAGLASFGAYVPKDLVRSIVSRAEKTGVGGSSREVSILFSDLQGFTARTETLEPEELMPALSRYFEVIETQIAQNKGIVDKYIGDAVMALWNAPLNDEKHVENACRGALACLAAEAQLNKADARSSPLLPLHTRIGIHSGKVIVGNVGSLSRMQYTALGSVVNLAARLEGLNKFYGTRILVSEFVERAVSDIFIFREVDVVSPVGTSRPTKIFELVGEANQGAEFEVSAAKLHDVANWRSCYAHYRAGRWKNALDAFKEYKKTTENVVLVDNYISRCINFAAKPPDDDWDGVYKYKEK